MPAPGVPWTSQANDQSSPCARQQNGLHGNHQGHLRLEPKGSAANDGLWLRRGRQLSCLLSRRHIGRRQAENPPDHPAQILRATSMDAFPPHLFYVCSIMSRFGKGWFIMVCLRSQAVLSSIMLACSTPAFGADPGALPIYSRSEREAGLTFEVSDSGFALVTFGRWFSRESDSPRVPHQTDFDRTALLRPKTRSGYSFRRAVYLPYVDAAERQFALPQGLLDALIWTESRYDPLAVSKAGAVGLGQLMRPTAHALGVNNRYDARANVWGAARYLRQMLDRFGQVHLALAAYNAGPGAVERAGRVPHNGETYGYVLDVLRNWQRR